MLYLGADHRGFSLKESLKKWLLEKNTPFEDLGNKILDMDDDYVDFAAAVAQKVSSEENSKGIVICGSGTGVCVVANKVKGVRCAVAINKDLVKQDREHDNINMLSLPAQATTVDLAYQLVEIFLKTDFSGQKKYQRRLNKIAALENK